jgi:hypothetical protein
LEIFLMQHLPTVMRWGSGENEGGCHEEPIIERSNGRIAPCDGSGLRPFLN